MRGQQSLNFALCVVVGLLLIYLLFRDRTAQRRLINFACAGALGLAAYFYYPNEIIRLGSQARASAADYNSYRENFTEGALRLENHSSVNNIVHVLRDDANWAIVNNGALQYPLATSVRRQEANWAVGEFLRGGHGRTEKAYIIGGSDGFLLAQLAGRGPGTVIDMSPARFSVLTTLHGPVFAPLELVVGDAFTLIAKKFSEF